MNEYQDVRLRKLTRREFRERMEQGILKACLIPVAAVEQHLEHLAMEHDWRSVQLIACQVAQTLSPSVLVAEGLMAGISEHHMNHPGTLTLQPGTFLTVLSDLIDSMSRAGFSNLIVLNGHGGNVAPLNGIWDQYLRRFKTNLHFLSYWDVLNENDAKLLKGDRRIPDDLPGHAQEFETSIALDAFSENVRTEIWSDQPDSKPSLATPELGAEMIARIVERVSAFVREIIEGKRQAEIPGFHP